VDLGLKDRVVLVTGGSSGIGRAAALAFAAEGARVAVTYRDNEEAAAKVVAEALEAGATEARAHPLDLGDTDSIDSALAALVHAYGGLDVLVNNAVEWPAPAWPADFAGMDPVAWRRTLRVNLEGVVQLTQQAVPLLVAGIDPRIVYLSSGTVEYGMPGEEPYAAAKAALQGIARCLARELGPQGVLVNTVMPGLTLTERCLAGVPEPIRDTVAQQTPTQRLSTPEDVAAAVVFLGSAANRNTTGEILRVSGGN
jgi:3-oxoacyl-[acyl-carrier protein] reductase